MSLQVWLPLNGNLENQGISSTSIINKGAVVDNNGKIGKCYSIKDSHINIDKSIARNLTGEFSISCWVYINSWNTSYQTIWSACVSGYSWDKLSAVFLRNGSNNSLCFSIADGSTAYVGNGCSTGTISSGKWYHFTCCYKLGSIMIYQDGVLVKEYKTSIIPNMSATTDFQIGGCMTSYLSDMKINDFRVYNHCLSAREVKEISKGLVCHIPMNDGGVEPTNNLCTTGTLGSDVYNGATSKYGYGTSTDIYRVEGEFQGKKSTKVYMGTDGLSAYPYVSFSGIHPAKGKYKSLSFDYFPTSQETITFYTYKGTADASYIVNGGVKTTGSRIPVKLNTWNHIELTLYGTSDETTGWGYAQIGKHTSSTTNYWLFANIQIEDKDHATIYTPTTRSEPYVYDSSGFKNNGNITNTSYPLFTKSSPRYNGCYTFDTNAKYITIPLSTAGFKDSYTISYWAKIGDMNGKMAWGFSNGNRLNIYPSSNTLCLNTGDGANNPFKNNDANVAFLSYNNAWHHYAVTGDGSSTKLYIDGSLAGTASTYKGITGTELYISGWNTSTDYKWVGGQISDFRIYSTVLSAEDVKELYNVPFSVANNGTLLIQGEVNEV